MNKKDYAVFILTYGRPNNIITYKTLRKCGYTGNIYLICSDDDKTLDEYKTIYKENVIVFSKKDYKGKFDIYDNFEKDNVVVYARNACFDIVKKLGYTYFLQLDDDYTDFRYKFDSNFNYIDKTIKNLDNIFNRIFDYYKTIPALAIAFSQGGDFIGGKYGSGADAVKIKRKIMNLYFMSTERRFIFTGRINEDTNTYVDLGTRGYLMFQLHQLALQQPLTQQSKGGLTEFYLDSGTYIKSFYTVITQPSCTKIKLMGNKNMRLHHSITWNNCTPKIIDEKYRNNQIMSQKND